MPITKNINFSYQEKTTQESTRSTSWTQQGRLIDHNYIKGGHEYVMIGWVNSTSPGGNHGGTKFAFEDGAGDIVGSVHQRHDTNSSGQYVAHIGHFIAPSPSQNIGIYRKMIYDDGESESTDYGQCFLIDLSYKGASGELTSGVDYSFSSNATTRSSITNGSTIHSHTIPEAQAGSNLILAISKVWDSHSSVLLDLAVDGTSIANGSRYVNSVHDMKSVPFAVTANSTSSSTVTLKNIDPQNLDTNYSFIFTLKLDDAPSSFATGQFSTWTNYGSSGSWGTQVINGYNDDSFIIAMGRQTVTGSESGRMAAISLKNNTTDEFLLFKNRPEGDFDPLYFPATANGVDVGQYELAPIIGVGKIGLADEIEMVTL